MSLDAINWARPEKCHSMGGKAVLLLLATYANSEYQCVISLQAIGEIFGMPPTWSKKVVHQLESEGKILVEKTRKRVKGRRYLFTLLVHPAFRTLGGRI